jgi:hypothetical protein
VEEGAGWIKLDVHAKHQRIQRVVDLLLQNNISLG